MLIGRRLVAFTLAEMLIAIAVLALLVLLITRLFNSAANITTTGNKRMDVDAQSRALFDRIAVDVAQMVKRTDVDYYLKSSANSQNGNDHLAFYSVVPGYSTTSASPISLVAYRINAQNKGERMAKGLFWNGDTSGTPIVFLPLTISSTWPAATTGSIDSDYELIAPNVFRFEYSYLLKNSVLSDTPWDVGAGHTGVAGMQDVVAISVAIAVIDPKSRVIVSDTQLTSLRDAMTDFASTMKPGDLITQWQGALDSTTNVPRVAVSAIRIYERYFQL